MFRFCPTLMNHPHTRLLITLSLVFFLQASLCLAAQEKKYHLFTDKKSQSIEAELLSVSQDKSKIKNLSRDELSGASLEYYIITEQGIRATVMDPAAQQTSGVKEWWYSNDPDLPSRRSKGEKPKPAKPLWLIHGTAQVEDLAYNFSAEFASSSFPLREIDQSETQINPKDKVLGVIVKITDEAGKEISIHRSNENKILNQSWDKISQMPTGDRSGIPQSVSNN